jgi:hypothetical protein
MTKSLNSIISSLRSGLRKEKRFHSTQRYGLQPGKYNLNFTFVDLGDTTNVYKSAAEVNVKDAPKVLLFLI